MTIRDDDPRMKITLLIDPDVLDWIDEVRTVERRSRSAQITRSLEQYRELLATKEPADA